MALPTEEARSLLRVMITIVEEHEHSSAVLPIERILNGFSSTGHFLAVQLLSIHGFPESWDASLLRTNRDLITDACREVGALKFDYLIRDLRPGGVKFIGFYRGSHLTLFGKREDGSICVSEREDLKFDNSLQNKVPILGDEVRILLADPPEDVKDLSVSAPHLSQSHLESNQTYLDPFESKGTELL